MTDVTDRDEDIVSGEEARPALHRRTFELAREIADFVEYTIPRVVPKKRSRWSEQITHKWSELLVAFSSKTPATQKLYVSKFRKALSDAIEQEEPNEERRVQLLDDLKAIVKIEATVYEQINAEYRGKVVTNTRALVFVPNYQEIVKVARSWLEKESHEHCAIALMLLTGRRFYEVLVAGDFSPTTIKVDRGKITPTWRMDFSGQLKTREAEGSKFQTLFNIPTLAPVRQIMSAVDDLRSSRFGREAAITSQETVNTHINPLLNKLLRASKIAELWPEKTELSIKSLRALYAEICYKHHAPAGIHKDAYFAEILGHQEGDMTTALSYVRFYLDDKDGDAARAELERITKAKEQMDAAYKAENPEPKTVRKSRHDPEAGDVSPDAIMVRLRKAKISLTDVSNKSGKHRTTVWRNLVASGSEDVHKAIAELLGVELSELWPSRYSSDE